MRPASNPVHVCITLGSKGNWSAFLTPWFIKVICLELFCSIAFIFLVFSHWAILIPVLVIMRDLNQVYLKLETLHSWFLDMNWVTSQSMMTLDWNLRKHYLKCMEIHGECGTTGADAGPPLLSTACEVSWAPEPRCFPPALLREGGTGSALSQVSSLFQVLGLWPRRTEAGGFVGTSQAYALTSPGPHLPLSRLSNWETNPDWLKLLSNFAFISWPYLWRSPNPNSSLFFSLLFCTSWTSGLNRERIKNNKCNAPKSETGSPIIIYKNMCPVPIAVLILILPFHVM